ncbi:hypothetical protein ABIE66_001013 [Peribacillus sp. B2I2]
MCMKSLFLISIAKNIFQKWIFSWNNKEVICREGKEQMELGQMWYRK